MFAPFASLWRLLVVGSEGNLGADRLAKLRRLVTHVAGKRLARRAAGHGVCFSWRKQVSFRPAFLWDISRNKK